jgi:hypothetical protein
MAQDIFYVFFGLVIKIFGHTYFWFLADLGLKFVHPYHFSVDEL